MGIELHNVKGIAGGWSVASKPCDICKAAAAAAIFCRVDSAFLCLNCDSRIHCVTKHERVWICQVCEQAPAAVTCKADAAALCVTCDNDIHSANPLARRHERHPVEPFYDSADSIVKSSALNFLTQANQNRGSEFSGACQQEGLDAGSWPLPRNSKLGIESTAEMKSGDLFFSEMDPFLDCEYQNAFPNPHHTAGMDSIVPVQTTKPVPIPLINNENCVDIDFCRSKLNSFSYKTLSLSQSVSSSSLDVGVVPDGNSMSDISYSFGGSMSSVTGTDPNVHVSGSVTTQANQISGIDREARVLRYREKRKNRKFEKTIRYHSRKAYAETRPRIKGRFAKRNDVETEVDRLYGSAASAASFMIDGQYGVVPSF